MSTELRERPGNHRRWRLAWLAVLGLFGLAAVFTRNEYWLGCLRFLGFLALLAVEGVTGRRTPAPGTPRHPDHDPEGVRCDPCR